MHNGRKSNPRGQKLQPRSRRSCWRGSRRGNRQGSLVRRLFLMLLHLFCNVRHYLGEQLHQRGSRVSPKTYQLPEALDRKRGPGWMHLQHKSAGAVACNIRRERIVRLLYILSHRQAEKFFASLGILDPSPAAFKQRRGTYFHYNRSAIGLACAQAIAMRIDIARHKRPIKPARRAPAPYLLHLPMHAQHV